MKNSLMKTKIALVSIAITLLSVPLFAQHVATVQDSYSTEVIVNDLNNAWAHVFLPNGDILVSERTGSIRVVRDKKLQKQAVANVPSVYFAGQGGLLDIMLDSNFAENRRVYLSYAFGSLKSNALRLISASLNNVGESYQLENISILFTASPLKSGPQHYSGRIAQLDDGTLLLGVGDGFDYREDAQKLDNHLGKIIRIKPDGSVPADNPFISTKGAKPEIWSYGHRNHQGLVVANGVVYQHEHGPKGGDEVNIIQPGLNYGWPVITYGRDYNGARISPYQQYQGMQQPKVDWTPSIAPSSMAFHQNKLYASALAEQSIRMLAIDGDKISDQGIVFSAIEGRIRDISSGPDGRLYVLTDGAQGQLIAINKKNLNQ